ncbi:MAG: LPS assembly lipoprotein LptE [Verrucomicrobiota bacterium]
MNRSFRLVFGAAAALLLNGCAGYHLGTAHPQAMEGVHTVAVPTFTTTSLVPRLEVLAADSVIAELQRDGTYQVVSGDYADAVIQGTISGVHRHPSRSIRSDVTGSREFTLTVDVKYTVTRRTTQEELQKGTVHGDTSFFVSGFDVNQDERQALPLALQNAAVRLVTQVTEGW